MAVKTVFPRATYLAILQQAEYDLALWLQWVQREDRDQSVISHLQDLTPEKNTLKLRLIDRVSRLLGWIMGPVRSIYVATILWRPVEGLIRQVLLWQARRRLRFWQKRGLTVIAIAGSYGKTSLKHSLAHLLGTQAYTQLTPASFNTPLGIAQTIKQINHRHRYCILELGEYEPGDIDQLLQLTQPEIGILTPIGYAHLARFGSPQALTNTLAEMITSAAAPPLLLINDHNRAALEHFTSPKPQQIIWYGQDKNSDVSLANFKGAWPLSSAQIRWPDKNQSLSTSLISAAQVVNCLPGLWLLQQRHRTLATGLRALQYHPAIARRYEIHHNPNGTIVIDNSYNTNPATWIESRQIIDELKLPKLAVLTAGFVELDASTTHTAHQQLAADLAPRATIVGLIRTHGNDDLRAALAAHHVPHVVGNSYHEVLSLLATSQTSWRTLWLEGGARELYL